MKADDKTNGLVRPFTGVSGAFLSRTTEHEAWCTVKPAACRAGGVTTLHVCPTSGLPIDGVSPHCIL